MDVEKVLNLRKSGMPWAKIAKLNGISRNAMYKFRRRLQLEEPNNCHLTNEELLPIIQDLNDKNPTYGSVLLRGCLLSKGIHVAENRVRAVLRQVDEEGVEQRKAHRLHRREYFAPFAKFIYHIDGNAKLIMWGFVLHGCIDGFSRRIIYVEVNSNNRAATVLQVFKAATDLNGLPEKVRGDHGVENGLVCDYIQSVGGNFIFGPSTRNTRIERLWREVNEKVTSLYKAIFFDLEDEMLLDELDVLDLFCLHYVYLFRIQSSLCTFVDSHNDHNLRGEVWTPNQMWFVSMDHENPEERIELCTLSYSFTIDSLIKNICNASFLTNVPEPVITVWLQEAVSFLPDPLVEDGAYGKNLYIDLRHHLLSVSDFLDF